MAIGLLIQVLAMLEEGFSAVRAADAATEFEDAHTEATVGGLQQDYSLLNPRYIYHCVTRKTINNTMGHQSTPRHRKIRRRLF